MKNSIACYKTLALLRFQKEEYNIGLQMFALVRLPKSSISLVVTRFRLTNSLFEDSTFDMLEACKLNFDMSFLYVVQILMGMPGQNIMACC